MSCSGIKSIALSILSTCFIFYSIKVILSVITFDISISRSKNYISLILNLSTFALNTPVIPVLIVKEMIP